MHGGTTAHVQYGTACKVSTEQYYIILHRVMDERGETKHVYAAHTVIMPRAEKDPPQGREVLDPLDHRRMCCGYESIRSLLFPFPTLISMRQAP